MSSDDIFGLKQAAVSKQDASRQAALDDIEIDGVSFSGEDTGHRKSNSKKIPYKLLNGVEQEADLVFTMQYEEFEVWSRNNRPTVETLEDLESKLLKTQGNIQPGLARIKKNVDGKVKYEIIYGGRRFRVCRKHNLPFQVIIVNSMPDEIAQLYTSQENQARLDVNPVDHGIYLGQEAKILRAKASTKVPDSEIAEIFSISKSKFSKYMAMVNIPDYLFVACPKVIYDPETEESKSPWAFRSAYEIARAVPLAEEQGVDLAKEIGSRRFESSDSLLKAIHRVINKKPGSSPRKTYYADGAVEVAFGKSKNTLQIKMNESVEQSVKDKIIALLDLEFNEEDDGA